MPELVSAGTSRTPGRPGTAARAPTLRKMRSAARRRSPTATSFAPVSRAWPAITVSPSVAPSQSSWPLRPSATMASTRAITAGMSAVTGPVAMP